jgi:hypothetical protein
MNGEVREGLSFYEKRIGPVSAAGTAGERTGPLLPNGTVRSGSFRFDLE